MKVYERTENGTVTHVSVKEALFEVNHAMMAGKKDVREMSSSRGDHRIEYRDGRIVRMILVDAPEPEVKANPFYCRTFSATTRHIIKPDTNGQRTLCGHGVALPEEYLNEAGELERPESWMILDLPPCARCEKSAAKHGLSK